MSQEERKLNEEQKQAVEYNSGPLLIVAGAGTGKTTAITEKIKFLIEKGLAKPEEILALTFTEKAAREMEERVDVALPYGTFGMWIMTFHSFCDRILRLEGLHIGINPDYKLMTEAESYLFVKNNFWKFNLNYFRPHGNPYKFIAGMLDHFSRLKDEDVTFENYKNADFPELVEAFKVYEELKVKEGVMDFSDLISYVLKLFRERPKILAGYQAKFKYILLDEFQDTNYAQYQMVKLLCADDCDVTVVGDDNQSIYKFRGAAISNILTFKDDYPKSKKIILNENYRSSQTILDSAYRLIKNNDPDTLEASLGISKKLKANAKYPEEKIEFNYFDRGENEAEYVAKKISELRTPDSKLDYRDFAILVRANNHSEIFIRALERKGIPYQFLGPGQLYRQPEIKDLIAYLKFLTDFTDTVSLYRVLSMEVFDFKQRSLIELISKAKKKNLSLFEQMEYEGSVIANEVKQSSTDQEKFASSQAPRNDNVKGFVTMVHKHQELIHKESAGQILYFFLEDSGLLRLMAESKTKLGELQAQNIVKFFDKLKSLEGRGNVANLFSAVEYLELAMEAGESPVTAETDWLKNNAVNILTLHSAKGLEFPVVFLVNLVDGRFPSRERKEQIPIPENLIKEILPTGDFHLQEERRLCYVGMTRAKQRLFFTAAGFYGEGKRERKISPFVKEALGEITNSKTQSKEKEDQLGLFEWSKPAPLKSEASTSIAKINYLSYSAIETFRMCPLHFKLKNILRIPTPPSPAQSMGNSTHLILRDLYLSKGGLSELMEKNWISEGYKSKKHEAEAKKRVEGFLRSYLDSEIHKKAKPLYLEHSFTFKLTDDLKIGGKFDRIDDLGGGKIEIVDYKTGANVPTVREIDAALQMTIYTMAAVNPAVFNKKVEDVKLSFFYFETGEKISTVRTAEQLVDAKREILEIRNKIEKSGFQCSHSILCQSCEFKILCS